MNQSTPGHAGGEAFYGGDLAFIHDVGFTWFVTESMPALEGLLIEHGVRDGRVVDLGCGSGVWLGRLLELGYAPVGIDVSARMLGLARDRAPGAELIEGSFFDVEIPRCKAVTAIGECFNYIGHSDDADETLPALLGRIHAALEPGGALIFDLARAGRAGESGTRNFRTGDDWAILFEAIEDPTERSLERSITTFRKEGELYRRGIETHRLRLHDPEEVLAAMRSVGFSAERLDSYGDRAFPAGYGAFVGKKH